MHPLWSPDNIIYQPWPPEDEELFRLCSPGTMFEDLSIQDMEARNEPSPQEAKLQHMEDTMLWHSNCIDILSVQMTLSKFLLALF